MMIFLLLLPIICLAGPLTPVENIRLQRNCGRTFQFSFDKSVNTDKATRFEAPFAVTIRSNKTSDNIIEKSFTRCSGTLISPRHVITAAHCVHRVCNESSRDHFGCLKNQFVMMTTSCLPNEYDNMVCDSQYYVRIIRVFMSNVFGSGTAYGDVAVYELEHDVPFSETVWPACVNTIERPPGSPLVMFGYGRNNDYTGTGSGVLRRHPTEVVSHAKCNKYGNGSWVRGTDVICTRHQRGFACSGDSGSGQVYIKNGKAFVTGTLGYGKRCHANIRPEEIMDFSASTIYHNRWICAATGICPNRIFTEGEKEVLTQEYIVIER